MHLFNYICMILRVESWGFGVGLPHDVQCQKQKQLKSTDLNDIIWDATVLRLTLFKAKMGDPLYRRASFLHKTVQIAHKRPLFTLGLVCSGSLITAIGGCQVLHLHAGLVGKWRLVKRHKITKDVQKNTLNICVHLLEEYFRNTRAILEH